MENTLIDKASPADVEAVARVATEYFQSWFAGDGERMRACLHPALAKRTPERLGAKSLTLHEDPPSSSSPTPRAARAPGSTPHRR